MAVVLGALLFAVTIREWTVTSISPRVATWPARGGYCQIASADGAFSFDYRQRLGLGTTGNRVVSVSRHRVVRFLYLPYWLVAAACLVPAVLYVVKRRGPGVRDNPPMQRTGGDGTL